nr:uncharacterized protein LOC100183734 [Ciona intestinalis]|eukprot:XP_026692896.1 uncharacterized protein LOC100183734 [Ciona intestinalis]
MSGAVRPTMGASWLSGFGVSWRPNSGTPLSEPYNERNRELPKPGFFDADCDKITAFEGEQDTKRRTASTPAFLYGDELDNHIYEEIDNLTYDSACVSKEPPTLENVLSANQFIDSVFADITDDMEYQLLDEGDNNTISKNKSFILKVRDNEDTMSSPSENNELKVETKENIRGVEETNDEKLDKIEYSTLPHKENLKEQVISHKQNITTQQKEEAAFVTWSVHHKTSEEPINLTEKGELSALNGIKKIKCENSVAGKRVDPGSKMEVNNVESLHDVYSSVCELTDSVKVLDKGIILNKTEDEMFANSSTTVANDISNEFKICRVASQGRGICIEDTYDSVCEDKNEQECVTLTTQEQKSTEKSDSDLYDAVCEETLRITESGEDKEIDNIYDPVCSNLKVEAETVQDTTKTDYISSTVVRTMKSEQWKQSQDVLKKTLKKRISDNAITYSLKDEYVEMGSQINCKESTANMVIDSSTEQSVQDTFKAEQSELMQNQVAGSSGKTQGEVKKWTGFSSIWSKLGFSGTGGKRERKGSEKTVSKTKSPLPSPNNTFFGKLGGKSTKPKSKPVSEKNKDKIKNLQISSLSNRMSEDSTQSIVSFEESLTDTISLTPEIIIFDDQAIGVSRLEKKEEELKGKSAKVTADDITAFNNSNFGNSDVVETMQTPKRDTGFLQELGKLFDQKYELSDIENGLTVESQLQVKNEIVIYDVPNSAMTEDLTEAVEPYYKVPCSTPVKLNNGENYAFPIADMNTLSEAVYDEPPVEQGEVGSPMIDLGPLLDNNQPADYNNQQPTSVGHDFLATTKNIETCRFKACNATISDEDVFATAGKELYSEPPKEVFPEVKQLVSANKSTANTKEGVMTNTPQPITLSHKDKSIFRNKVFENCALKSQSTKTQMIKVLTSSAKYPQQQPEVVYDDPAMLESDDYTSVPNEQFEDYCEIINEPQDDDDYIDIHQLPSSNIPHLQLENRSTSALEDYDKLKRSPLHSNLIEEDCANFEKVHEIKHGQCAVSTPYITVNKTPSSFNYVQNGDIYVSDCHGDGIDIYSSEGKHKNSLFIPGCPRGLTSYTSRHVLCASSASGEILVVDMTNGRVLRRIGGKSELRNPRCVTMHPDNQAFMTSDIKSIRNWALKLFDIRTGEVASSIECTGKSKIKIGWPEFLTYRNNSSHAFYVSDSESHAVYMFDARISKEPVFQIGQEGVQDGQFLSPCGLAFFPGGKLTIASSPGGSIVVADWGNHRLSAFDADTGHFQYQLIKNPTAGDFSNLRNPYDMSVDAEGTLYVTESKTNDIKIFKSV